MLEDEVMLNPYLIGTAEVPVANYAYLN